MFEILEKGLETTDIGRANLAQLRGQKRVMTACKVRNGVIEELSSISLNGISARVFVQGRSWGFSSTNTLNGKKVQQVLTNALKLARAAPKMKKHEKSLEPSESLNEDIQLSVKKPPEKFPINEIANIPLEAYDGAKEAGKRVTDLRATYISIGDNKYFLTSEGRRIHQSATRVMLYVDAIARSSSLICPASDNVGHVGGLELFDKNSPYSLGKKVSQKAVRLLGAKAPPPGRFTVIIHPTLCATLLHEAIGHPLEADIAMSGGGFGNQIGKLVSSRLVTIYDDGHVKRGLGHFPYDDEGIECTHNVLIENGMLRSFMHDRTSAAVAGAHPTGNAHAWDYSVEPLIRQTNIGIEAGEYSLEEMIENVKEGFFLEGTFGGQADSNADFTFGFQNAKRIEHGELKNELRGANVGGNAIEVFKTIDAVGEEAVLRPGACGKYQFAVQGRVVPAIRCKIVVGGTGGK